MSLSIDVIVTNVVAPFDTSRLDIVSVVRKILPILFANPSMPSSNQKEEEKKKIFMD